MGYSLSVYLFVLIKVLMFVSVIENSSQDEARLTQFQTVPDNLKNYEKKNKTSLTRSFFLTCRNARSVHRETFYSRTEPKSNHSAVVFNRSYSIGSNIIPINKISPTERTKVIKSDLCLGCKSNFSLGEFYRHINSFSADRRRNLIKFHDEENRIWKFPTTKAFRSMRQNFIGNSKRTYKDEEPTLEFNNQLRIASSFRTLRSSLLAKRELFDYFKKDKEERVLFPPYNKKSFPSSKKFVEITNRLSSIGNSNKTENILVKNSSYPKTVYKRETKWKGNAKTSGLLSRGKNWIWSFTIRNGKGKRNIKRVIASRDRAKSANRLPKPGSNNEFYHVNLDHSVENRSRSGIRRTEVSGGTRDVPPRVETCGGRQNDRHRRFVSTANTKLRIKREENPARSEDPFQTQLNARKQPNPKPSLELGLKASIKRSPLTKGANLGYANGSFVRGKRNEKREIRRETKLRRSDSWRTFLSKDLREKLSRSTVASSSSLPFSSDAEASHWRGTATHERRHTSKRKRRRGR